MVVQPKLYGEIMENNLITIKEYAKQNNISYEAVRKQIQKYKDNELQEHIIKNNRTQYLDEYAVDFLNNRRKESPVIIAQMDKDEEIQRLYDENKALLLKIAELQDLLLKEKDNVKQLQQDKIALLEANQEEQTQQPEQKENFWSRLWHKGN